MSLTPEAAIEKARLRRLEQGNEMRQGARSAAGLAMVVLCLLAARKSEERWLIFQSPMLIMGALALIGGAWQLGLGRGVENFSTRSVMATTFVLSAIGASLSMTIPAPRRLKVGDRIGVVTS